MIEIGGERPLALEDLAAIAREGREVTLADGVAERMGSSRRWVEGLFGDPAGPAAPVYGINTGFGALAGEGAWTDRESAAELSRRLVLSNACGTGAELEPEIVRAALAIRAASLTTGLSGADPRIPATLVAMLNRDVVPIVPEYGSLGASGDLIPLAYVALVATRPDGGVDDPAQSGEALHGGRRRTGLEAMREAGIERVPLGPKDGLALLNGTSFSTALAALAVLDALAVVEHAELAVALSAQAMLGFADAFLEPIHEARGHPGQIRSARRVRELLRCSRLIDGSAERDPVRQPPQDAYSIRCAPQVHGAVRDVLAFARGTVERELRATTDNPLILCGLPRALKAVSGGNFHAQAIAFASDFVSIAVTEIASISERRLARLVDPALNRGLPAMLIDGERPGMDCGFMLPQYLAAALVSDCRTLAHPDSVDSIPTSANQEDHVSMAMNAGRHARQAVENATAVIALELHAAAQAIDLRLRRDGFSIEDLSPATRAVHERIRDAVDFQTRDELLDGRVRAVRRLVQRGELLACARRAGGR
ncbi:MAG TPA: histidine ammonia-lyase [Solirubrobacteraceae bacterium]|nr:histidine ammonia-lyase [Solirubrobacteraceae bacterium]